MATPASSSPLPLASLREGLAYGALGLPLAFVALPLYVLLPDHYARAFGVPLAALGALLLAARLLDAVADPLIGAGVDRLLRRPPRQWACAGGAAALLLAAGFHGLFFPPADVMATGTPALLAWCALMLAACYAGYSALTIGHQAWGARLGGDAAQRTRVVAWREGLALVGVLAASTLPSLAGLGWTSALLAAALAGALIALRGAPRPLAPQTALDAPPARFAGWAPLRAPRFRALLAMHLLNGLAGAVPATLVVFFVHDRLQAPAWLPACLGLYFLAAALALPAWVRLVRRHGLLRCWAAGMALAIASFLGAAALGPGDAPAFLLICVFSGMALGADLAIPPALLAGLLREGGPGAPRSQDDGACFGWWQFVTKLGLALAAGLALPLLDATGYRPGTPPGHADTLPLALVYGLLPCGLKLLALGALWRLGPWLDPQPAPDPAASSSGERPCR